MPQDPLLIAKGPDVHEPKSYCLRLAGALYGSMYVVRQMYRQVLETPSVHPEVCFVAPRKGDGSQYDFHHLAHQHYAKMGLNMQ